MTKRRMCMVFRLRPESVSEYVRLHQHVWPELVEVYHKAGITQISCFLNGLDVVVYSEYELEVYRREKESLGRDPVELRWQSLMQTLHDPDSEMLHFEEIFYLPPFERDP